MTEKEPVDSHFDLPALMLTTASVLSIAAFRAAHNKMGWLASAGVAIAFGVVVTIGFYALHFAWLGLVRVLRLIGDEGLLGVRIRAVNAVRALNVMILEPILYGKRGKR